MKLYPLNALLLASLLLTVMPPGMAGVMKPESSMVLIKEEEGGASLNVTNTSDSEALLYVKVYDLPDDQQPQVLVTQPVTRVPAGQTQRVRFVLNSSAPLTTEHMKRVKIEGIPPASTSNSNTVGLTIRQDLPIIIHPRGLEMISDPWKKLEWSAQGGELIVKNPSAWVVRLAQDVTLLPGGKTMKLEKTYILPGQSLKASGADKTALSQAKQVQIHSLTKYGYLAGTFTVPLKI